MPFLKERVQLVVAFILITQWLIAVLLNIHYPVFYQTLLSGLSVVGAAFLISWAAETAEVDVPRSLSLAVVALFAVLPEYAVDAYFAWKAGSVGGAYVHYATANMTGANRLLIGIGWSFVALYAMYKTGESKVQLDEGIRLEIFFLLAATLYAFVLPLTGKITLYDTIVFVSLYVMYIYLTTRAEKEEFELVGVPAYLSRLPKNLRRFLVVFLFLFAGIGIFASVEAFSEGLLGIGRQLGVSEFLIVQWIAPLASEAPELIVAGYFVNKLRVTAGINALISSKINQWTLLIGTIMLVYSISAMHLHPLPLDARQSEEILLTASQSLFATAILLDLKITRKEAITLLSLFALQFVLPEVWARIALSAVYILLSIPIFMTKSRELRKLTSIATLAKR